MVPPLTDDNAADGKIGSAVSRVSAGWSTSTDRRIYAGRHWRNLLAKSHLQMQI